jgi:hypothetical protein
MHLAMIVPTRSRPEAARAAAYEARRNMDVRHFTTVYLAVDGEHEQTAEYEALPAQPNTVMLYNGEHRGMVGTLNHWARWLLARPRDWPITHVGFMGDDHRPRSPRWDTRLMEAAGDGIAYGNDLNMGRKLPTAVVISAGIVRALGRMAPPELAHLYVDNYWLELGRALGQLTYLDDVVIEHMHPSIGKGPDDEQYRRVNSPEQFKADGEAWRTWRDAGGLAADVEVIRRHRERP